MLARKGLWGFFFFGLFGNKILGSPKIKRHIGAYNCTHTKKKKKKKMTILHVRISPRSGALHLRWTTTYRCLLVPNRYWAHRHTTTITKEQICNSCRRESMSVNWKKCSNARNKKQILFCTIFYIGNHRCADCVNIIASKHIIWHANGHYVRSFFAVAKKACRCVYNMFFSFSHDINSQLWRVIAPSNTARACKQPQVLSCIIIILAVWIFACFPP